MNIDQYKRELANWCSEWAAISNNIGSKQEKTTNKKNQIEINENENLVRKWQSVLDQTKEELLKERTKEAVKQMIASPNPVSYTTVGKDQEVRVTPNFTDGKELQEIVKLKLSLEDLEKKLQQAEIDGKDGSKIQDKINKMKEDIEELSNLLIPPPSDVS